MWAMSQLKSILKQLNLSIAANKNFLQVHTEGDLVAYQ